MPILAGVHLDGADGVLSTRAFDHETNVVSKLAVKVETPGVALVSHRLLTQVLSVATTATVDLVLEDTRLRLVSGRAAWRLPLMTVDAYPLPLGTVAPLGDVDGEEFHAAVERVVTAASYDGVTLDIPLHATYLGLNVDTLTLVATDKYQMHTAVVPFRRSSEDATPFVLVPAGRLHAVTRTLTDGRVTVGVSENRLSLADGTTAVTTALAAAKGGTWVNWQALFTGFTSDKTHRYQFNRDELLTTLKQAATLADVQASKARHVTLTITTADALVQAASGVDGDAAVPLATTGYDAPEPLVWTVNADYLTSAVHAADADPVQFTQQSPKHPVGIGPVGEPATQSVMPIRKAV
jgi:DNA polymerase-3 subunit beta